MFSQRKPKKAIFLDRDGVINVDKRFVFSKEDFEWVDGVKEALKKLQESGYELIIVTNQSGIGLMYYSVKDFMELTRWMLDELEKEGVEILDVYYCPHAPDANCDCRKPAPGMILDAAETHTIDLKRSWMIGDKTTDILAGKLAGIPAKQCIKVSPKKTLANVVDKIVEQKEIDIVG